MHLISSLSHWLFSVIKTNSVCTHWSKVAYWETFIQASNRTRTGRTVSKLLPRITNTMFWLGMIVGIWYCTELRILVFGVRSNGSSKNIVYWELLSITNHMQQFKTMMLWLLFTVYKDPKKTNKNSNHSLKSNSLWTKPSKRSV